MLQDAGGDRAIDVARVRAHALELPGGAAEARKHPIQGCGERLLRPSAVWWRATRDSPRNSCLIHEVTD